MTVDIRVGDCRSLLAAMPAESVHCVVTSPPFWGLRDYGLPPSVWGGVPDCEHAWAAKGRRGGGSQAQGSTSQRNGRSNVEAQRSAENSTGAFCALCGAWLGTLGLEPTPDCRRPTAEPRPGLTAPQLEFVAQQLRAAGLLDAFPHGMDGRVLSRSLDHSARQDTHPTTSDGAIVAGVERHNPDTASHPDQGQPAETLGTQDDESRGGASVYGRPSSSGEPDQQDADSAAVDSPRGARPGQSPGDAQGSSVGQQGRQRSSPPSQGGKEPRASLGGHAAPPQSSPEPLAAGPGSDGDSAKSADRSESKNERRDLCSAAGTDRSLVSTAWAYYILPQDLHALFRPRLCGQCYVCHMVEVFRELRRVLRPGSLLVLNLGDTYYGSGGAGGDYNAGGLKAGQPKWRQGSARADGVVDPAKGSIRNRDGAPGGRHPALKPKDLCGIPWRVVMALQADGWWWRSALPWVKRNPMPESATDRPSTAVEYVFLLAKSARPYWDAEAVRQAHQDFAGPVSRFGNTGVAGGYQGTTLPDAQARGSFPIRQGGRQYNPAGRSMRNSDLFYQSLAPPHGLITDADGEPLALDVNTHGFSGWTQTSRRVRVAVDDADDDMTRIPSLDCPVHEDHSARAASVQHDEHEAGPFGHNSGSDGRLALGQQGGRAPIAPRRERKIGGESSDSLPRECSETATRHSSGIHRTARAPETTQPCMPCDETGDCNSDTSALPSTHGPSSRMSESNTSPDDQADLLSAQTRYRNGDKFSCTCSYEKTVTGSISHFATFPERFVEPFVKAGTSERGVCAECGAPWRRVISKPQPPANVFTKRNAPSDGLVYSGSVHEGEWKGHGQKLQAWLNANPSVTTGWEPTCAHADAPVVPATVLDPFSGAGTTSLVAAKLGRDSIGLELNPEYASMSRKRVAAAVGVRTPAEAPVGMDTQGSFL